MREFNSLQAFAAHLVTLQTAELVAMEHGLEKAAKLVEQTAKRELGHYQPAVGPFQDWGDLAESTKADRLAHGYTENDPGIRSGDMERSISHERQGLEAQIGSPDENLVYFEFGTEKQPPRPVLGPAAFKNKGKIKRILGYAIVTGLIGGDIVHESLGYDMEV